MMYKFIMLIRNFIPGIVKKLIHRLIYNSIAKRSEERKVRLQFLNLGYVDDIEDQLLTTEFDDINNVNIELYNQLFKECDLKSKDILEVGCGAGGGCYLVSKYFAPSTVTGVDMSDKLISSNKKKYSNSDITFKQGDAENLPLKDNSRDVVVNLESSHCYPSKEAFIKEVKRVLRKEGMFLYADIMETSFMQEMQKLIEENFEIVKTRNISDNVVIALDKVDSKKNETIDTHGHKNVPRSMQNIFYVTTDSRPYKGLKNGEMVYQLIIAKNSKE